jgi:hypothetical protein
MVAGLFRCRSLREDDRWFDVCRLSLMHLRVGMSVGFVARRLCSICDRDLTTCDHIPGTRYPVVAAHGTDGSCNICGSAEGCEHAADDTYLVSAHGIVREVDRLDEISTVARPRDPLARINGIEIPADALSSLPRHDDANASLYCESCRRPCTGFTSVEEALGRA